MQNGTIERTGTPAAGHQAHAPIDISRIILVGCGGVGSFIAQHLGLVIGVEALLLVDGDKFERKNTNRQALAFQGIGEYKTALVSDRLMGLNVDVATESNYITTDNWPDLIAEFEPTLIISAVDNDEARRLIFSTIKDLPVLWGANELWTPQAGISLPQKPWNPLEAFQAAEEAGTACGIQTVHANACAAAMAMQLLMMHSSEHEQWDKLPMFMSKSSGERIFTMMPNEIF